MRQKEYSSAGSPGHPEPAFNISSLKNTGLKELKWVPPGILALVQL